MKYLQRFLFSFLVFLFLSCVSFLSADGYTYANESSRNYQKGIDISHHQGDIKWSSIDTSLDFIICKATEGVSFVDPKFKQNWDSIECAKGCYHFFRPQYSGEKQAQLYLSNINLEPGNIKPIIDVEMTNHWKNHSHRKKYVQNLKNMVNTIISKTGQVPIIYTNGNFWNDYISKYYDYSHILWIADYRKRDNPNVPKDFNDWIIWQHSDKGKISGINGYVDLNYCKNIDTLLIK
jgi:lysozyme